MALILVLCMSITGISYANFISNPGFEDYLINDFAFWTEGGDVRRVPSPVYEGLSSAFLRVGGGSLYQTFSITEGDSLYYGAYFLIGTQSLTSNWDQVQISLQIDSLPWTTIGGSVSNFIDVASFVWARRARRTRWNSRRPMAIRSINMIPPSATTRTRISTLRVSVGSLPMRILMSMVRWSLLEPASGCRRLGQARLTGHVISRCNKKP